MVWMANSDKWKAPFASNTWKLKKANALDTVLKSSKKGHKRILSITLKSLGAINRSQVTVHTWSLLCASLLESAFTLQASSSCAVELDTCLAPAINLSSLAFPWTAAFAASHNVVVAAATIRACNTTHVIMFRLILETTWLLYPNCKLWCFTKSYDNKYI